MNVKEYCDVGLNARNAEAAAAVLKEQTERTNKLVAQLLVRNVHLKVRGAGAATSKDEEQEAKAWQTIETNKQTTSGKSSSILTEVEQKI